MKNNFITYLIVLILLLSCSNKKNRTNNNFNQEKNSINFLYDKAINKGDTLAYYELSKIYIDSPYSFEEFENISIEMANKYDYELAHIKVVLCLKGEYKGEKDQKLISELDINKREIVLKHLKSAYEKGNSIAIDVVKEENIKW